MKEIISISFKEFLSIFLEDHDPLGWGRKYPNVDIKNVPEFYLKWIIEKADPKFVSAELRKRIEQELERRKSEKRIIKTAGVHHHHQEEDALDQSNWVLSQSLIDFPDKFQISKGDYVVLQKRSDGNWNYLTSKGKQGLISNIGIKGKVRAIRDESQKPEMGSPKELFEKVKKELKIDTTKKGDFKTIPDELMSDEQEKIDKKFESIIKSPTSSHMMINALAGTGKTTILKHLAWKYGEGQKWLYLVFNTKNKIEAKEKFPPWVEVATTNGFLGKILDNNTAIIPKTTRIKNITSFDKLRIITDSNEYKNLLKDLINFPDSIPNKYGKSQRSVESIFKSIKYYFNENVIKLTSLLKAFAVNPKNEQELNEGIKTITSKYDFDFELEDVKERITKYKPGFMEDVLNALDEVFGYNILNKNFEEEMTEASKWVLKNSLPGNTNIKFNYLRKDFDLNDFRDFEDDIWLPIIYADKISWPKFDVVLADEVQDFNPAQKIMLQQLAKNGSKVVAVGDPNQSIYRFRGTDAKSFHALSKMLSDLSGKEEGEIVKELKKNFRSRKRVLDFANEETIVKNLVSGKKEEQTGDEEDVATKYKYSFKDSFDTIENEFKDDNLKQTAFISRTNEPLIHTALMLLNKGVPFAIVGKDISGELKSHIRKIMKIMKLNDFSSVSTLAEKLEVFLRSENEKHFGESAKKAYLQSLNEITNAVVATIGQFERDEKTKGEDIKTYLDWIDEKLGGLNVEENEKDYEKYKEKMEKENPVVLTTAHRSKGLEFDRVYVLRYDQFPHPKTNKEREEEIEQEENARYVTITRAKDEVHILSLEGQPGYEEQEKDSGESFDSIKL